MRIGLLTTSYPRFERDTAGLFVHGFARTLARLGHRVHVLAPEPQQPACPIDEPGVAVSWVRYAPSRAMSRTFYSAGVPDNVRRDPLAWPGLLTFPVALLSRARRFEAEWDALVSHWALPSALVAASVKRGRNHVAVLHSADVHLLSRLPARRRVADAILSGARVLWFVSARHARRFQSWLPPSRQALFQERFMVCPMGFYPSARKPVSAQPARPLVLAFIGRLVSIKGLETLMDAMAAKAGLRLLVAGEGPEKARLHRRAVELGVDVRWLGSCVDERKAQLFAEAHLCVVPSRRLPSGREEGLPVSALEAAHAGVPLLVSRASGLAEVFRPEREALVVDGEDPAAWAHALGRLEEEGLRARLAVAGQRRAEGYTWHRLSGRIGRLFPA